MLNLPLLLLQIILVVFTGVDEDICEVTSPVYLDCLGIMTMAVVVASVLPREHHGDVKKIFLWQTRKSIKD